MASPLLRRRVRLSAKKKPTKKRPTTRRTVTLKQRTDQNIARVRQRLEDAQATYYDIGKTLLSLRKPEIWQLYAETTYKGFLNAHVMPYTTALRMVTVAEAYPKKIALQMGQERGFQLARLARLDPKLKAKPADLWTRNAKLGKHRVQSMSATEIAQLVTMAVLRTKKKKSKPRANTAQREAYEDLKEEWADVLGHHEADFELDLKKGVVRIEVKLTDLLE